MLILAWLLNSKQSKNK